MSVNTRTVSSEPITETPIDIDKKQGQTILYDRNLTSEKQEVTTFYDRKKTSVDNIISRQTGRSQTVKTREMTKQSLNEQSRVTKRQLDKQKSQKTDIPTLQLGKPEPSKFKPTKVDHKKPEEPKLQSKKLSREPDPDKPDPPKPNPPKRERRPIERCFGYFGCRNCGNDWAWRIRGTLIVVYRQKCQQCRIYTFPYKTEYLRCSRCGYPVPERICGGTDSDLSADREIRPHRADLCEKCRTSNPCRFG